MKLCPSSLADTRLRLRFELEIARLELRPLALEALAVGFGGAQRLALRQQKVAREAVLDGDHVAHLSEAPDALEQNDLHVRHSCSCQIVSVVVGGMAAAVGALAQAEQRLGQADEWRR